MDVLLWSVDEAAHHWGVSPSRARAILAGRRIHRISGYPSMQIKSVELRQGARTDLHPPPPLANVTAISLVDTAEALTGASTMAVRLRLFFEFMRGATESGPAYAALTQCEPTFTGDPRFDALLAAAAEYLASQWGQPGPLWSVAADRFLLTSWWVSDLPSARAAALVGTPAAFRRRGIYLDRHDLTFDGTPTMPEPLFDQTTLQHAFALLAERLHAKNITGQVHVVGGAAMLLAYQSRVTTRDIDALFVPDGPMLEAIWDVAQQLGWPRSWLNNNASSYMSRTPGAGQTVFDHPNLQVVATPPDHLLAMKVLAARPVRDRDDIELLLDSLRITAASTVWDIVSRFFPDDMIPDRSRLLVEDIFAARQPRNDT